MMNKQCDKKIQNQACTDQIDEENEKHKNKDFKDDNLYLLQQQIQEQSENKKSEIHKLANLTQWQNYQEYLLFFENISIFGSGLLDIFKAQQQHQKVTLQLQQQLKKNNFILMKTINQNKLNQTERQSKIQMRLINKSKNYEVVQILCQLGEYAKIYTVLNQTEQSHRHQNKVIGIGTFGKVFLRQHNKNQSVVKCLRFASQNINSLKNHIKQYFLCDMMSTLQIGPKILRSNGFDFILFNDCMQFQMEKCQHKADEKNQTQLKQGLIKMHLLSIVHSDIKPANIMFSKQFRKNVFLDFGTSQILKEVIGQKSLVNFRGTYQFCGKQMKKIFLSQRIQKVDLYSNDVEMLTNSLYCSKNICADLIIFQKEQIKGKKKNEILNSSKQLQFSFKYHLYANQYFKQPTNLLLQFLAEFQKDTNYKENIQIMLSAIKFTSQIRQLALTHLQKNQIWKSSKYKQIQFIMNDPQFFNNDIQNDYSEKIDHKSVENLYNQLVRKSNNQNVYNQKKVNLLKILKIVQEYKSDQNQWLFNQRQNENSQHICQKSQTCCFLQQLLKSFLRHCSFCQSQFRYSIQEKQYFAKLLFKMISSSQKLQKISTIIKDQYLPISTFAKTKCKNLVLVYQYLLNYCYENLSTKFSYSNILIILKDCITLGFQYFYFMQEFFVKRFCVLINFRQLNIITQLALQTKYFVYLTDANFISTKQKNPLYQKKYFKLCLKNILLNVVKYFDSNVSQSQFYYSKRKSLEVFWEAFLSQQKSKFYNNNTLKEQARQKAQMIINQIQNETSRQTIYIFESVIIFLIDQSQKITLKNIQIKTPLSKYINQRKLSQKINSYENITLSHQEQSKTDKQTEWERFDELINCFQLSKMFFVGERLEHYLKQNFNDDSFYQIWNLIQKYQGSSSINYTLFEGVNISNDNLNYNIYPMKLHEPILERLHYWYFSLLEIFEQTQKQDFVIKFLQALHDIYNMNNGFLLKQRPVLYQKLNRLKKNHSQQSLVYMIIKKIQLALLPYQSMEYIQKQKQFFQLYLKMMRQYKIMNCFMKDEEGQNMTVTFFNLIFFSHFFFDQHLKFWENSRIKIILRKPQFLTMLFHKLYYILFITNNSKYLIEIFCFFCKEINLRVNHSFYTLMNRAIQEWIPSKKLKIDLYSDFIENLKIIIKKNPYPIYLIPVYIFILGFLKQIDADLIQWKQLLIQVINLNEKIPKNVERVYQSIEKIAYTFPEQFYLLFLQYFQKKIQSQDNQKSQFKIQYNRKYKMILRKLLKNKIISKFFYQKQIQQYIQKYSKMQEVHFLYQRNPKKKTIKRLFLQKFKKYKQNCLHNITFSDYRQNHHKQSEQNRMLQEILLNSKQKMMRFEELYYPSRIQFLKKYKIKNIKIFQQKHISCFYRQLVVKKQFINMSQKEFCDKMEAKENQIEKIKKTEEYKLCEQTVDIIDQILDLQRQILLKELKQTKKLEEKDIKGKWIQSFT